MNISDLTALLKNSLSAIAVTAALTLSAVSAAQEYTVNLKDTDIQEFIKFVADVTGTTMVIDPNVKGKVRVISSKPVSQAELYDLFLSILDVQGYTAVRSEQVIRIVPSKDARSSPVPIMEDQAAVGNDEYVTQVIRLDNISAAKLIPVLRPLVPQQAHMAAYAPSNAIIISDIRSNIGRIVDIIERMDRSAVQTTEIIRLKYGVAEDVVSMLNTLEKSRQGEGAEADKEAVLVADKRTNSVVVTADEMSVDRIRKLVAYLDTPLEQSGNVRVIYLEYAADTDEMAALEAVIARLDIRRAQVLIEAIIVEVTVLEGQELGLQWLFANDSGVYGSNITTNEARRNSLSQLGGALVPDDGSENIGTREMAASLATIPGTTLGWGVVDESLTMTVILNALESQGNTNILSTPSLLTLDNEEAFITVGQQVPFVTGSYTNTGVGNGASNPFQTIERQSVGVTLKVTPQINEGDAVVMDITQEVSSLGPALIASDIITNERKIETMVLANDGNIVVLGGLVEDKVTDSSEGVPVLSSIPLLGRLFRSDAVEVTKQNLLVFIRPTIIRNDEDLAGATAEKYRFIRDQQMERRERGLMFLDDGNLPVLPTWEEQLQQLPEVPADDAGQE